MRAALLVGAVVTLSACGRLGFSDSGSNVGPDASPDGGAGDTDARVDARPADAVTVDAVFACGAGYLAWGGQSSGYRVGTIDKTWLAAEQDCEADGGHLVVSDTVEEDAAVHAVGAGVWLGVTDRVTEGTFLAVVGGAPPYSGWPGSPPANVAEDCVNIISTGDWEDQDCNVSFRYVCECDGQPAVAGTY